MNPAYRTLRERESALLSVAGAVGGASAVGTWEESEMPEVSFTREILGPFLGTEAKPWWEGWCSCYVRFITSHRS